MREKLQKDPTRKLGRGRSFLPDDVRVRNALALLVLSELLCLPLSVCLSRVVKLEGVADRIGDAVKSSC